MNYPIKPYGHVRSNIFMLHTWFEPQSIGYRNECRLLAERSCLINWPPAGQCTIMHARMTFTFRIKRGKNPLVKSCLPIYKKCFGGLGEQWATKEPKIWKGTYYLTYAN